MVGAILTTRSFIVRGDLAAVRSTMKAIKRNNELAPLNLFGRRNAERMLDYLDRRCENRSSVHLPVFVTPASFDGKCAELPEGEEDTMMCWTKDVSLKAIGFSHDQPLDAEWAAVSFDLSDAYVVLLLNIRWKNVETDSGSLMSGGRFAGVLE